MRINLKEKIKKSYTLTYLIYIISILILTLFFSLQLLTNKELISPIGKMAQPVAEKIVENQLIDSLKQFVKEDSAEKEKGFNKTNLFFNSLGFKDYEWQVEKPANTYRIIALGDSMTQGAGVSNNDTLPKQLERELNEFNRLRKFEVLNMGGPIFDTGTPEEVGTFKNIGLKYSPDMTILQYYGGDWRSPEMKAKAVKLWEDYKEGKYNLPSDIEKEVHRLKASEISISRIIYEIISRDYLTTTSSDEEWNKWVKPYLNELIDICQSKGIKLIVITWDTSNIREEKNNVASILNNRSIPFYDFSEYLPSSLCPSSLRLPDCHLTPAGYEIVANITFEIISNQLR